MNCPECGIPLVRQNWHSMHFDIKEPAEVFTISKKQCFEHSDICSIRSYECENFHEIKLSLINRCVKCKWQGKTECKCSKKVERWPDDEQSNPNFTGKVEKWRGFNSCVLE